ncbi:MAG: CHAT domain-containing protein [Candidatus Spyradosoma sp.]
MNKTIIIGLALFTLGISLFAEEPPAKQDENPISATSEKSALELFVEADSIVAAEPKRALEILKSLNTPEKIKEIAEEARASDNETLESLSDEKLVEISILSDFLGVGINTTDLVLTGKALETLKPLVEAYDGEKGGLYEAMGTASLTLHFPEEGMRLLLKARAEGRNSPTLALNLSFGSNLTGNFLMAEEYAREALRKFKDPYLADFRSRAKQQLAMALIGQDKISEATELIDGEFGGITENISNDDSLRWVQLKLWSLEKEDCSEEEKIASLKKIERILLQEEDLSSALYSNFLSLKAGFLMGIEVKSDEIWREIIQTSEKYFDYVEVLRQGVVLGEFFEQRDRIVKKIFMEALKHFGDEQKLSQWESIFEIKSRAMEQGHVNPSVSRSIVLANRISSATRVLENPDSDEEMKKNARSALTEAETEFDAILKKDRENARYLEQLRDSFIIREDYLQQFSRTLPKDGAIIRFVVLEDKIAATVVKSDGIPVRFNLQPSSKFRRDLDAFRKALHRGDRKTADRKAKTLYQTLIKPLCEALEGVKSLRLNTSIELRELPFAALFDGEKYLIESYELSYVSGHDMVRLAKSDGSKAVENIHISVFANPELGLKGSELEGEAIQKIFGESVDLFCRKDATKTHLEDSLRKGVNVLHLATHGVLDEKEPLNSGLLLFGGELWAYSDMLRAGMNQADLITLSACSTAKGKEDFEGFALRLIEKAPADSVIASFWPVDDVATQKLMEAFYLELNRSLKTAKRYGRAKALQAAQLAMLREKATASPCLWAAFALWGDSR